MNNFQKLPQLGIKQLKDIMHLTVFSSILFIGLTSCKKDPPVINQPTAPTLPALTHTGANTFGCYIDGELFVANDGESVWSIPAVSGSFDEETRELTIQGTRYSGDNIREFIVLLSDIIDNKGQYKFKTYEGDVVGYRNHGGDNCDYNYNPMIDEYISITYLNETKNIISGTFSMTLINKDCPTKTTLKITDGRFDFHY